MTNEITKEIRRMIRKSGILEKRGINRNRMRALYNPKTFDLVIEACQITGEYKWLKLILEKIKLKETTLNMGQE